MSTGAKRSAAHKALLIVAPLLVLAYGGVGGWLYLAGPPEVAEEKPTKTDDLAKEKPSAVDPKAEVDEAEPTKTAEPAKSAPVNEPEPLKPEPAAPADPPVKAETKPETEEPPKPVAEAKPAREPEPASPARATPTRDGSVMAVAPDPELTVEGVHGPLPIRANGRSPWKVYGRPFQRQPGARLIAIVITELGLAEPPTLSAIQDLPGEVSLAFSPYSRRLAEWVPGARAAGHEVLLQIPMEPRNLVLDDPGDRALLTGNDPATNIDNLSWVLSRATGYVGVTSFMGSKLTVSADAMRPILDVLEQRGLAYVDARVTPLSIAGRLGEEIGVPTATNDRFIDPQAARQPIDARLAELEQIALSQGTAVGFAQAYPVTIERLQNWIPGMRRRGFELAPITAIVAYGKAAQ